MGFREAACAPLVLPGVWCLSAAPWRWDGAYPPRVCVCALCREAACGV
jgi:hypothetical protein